LSWIRRQRSGSSDDRAIVQAIRVLEALPPGQELVDAYAERGSLEYTRGNDLETIGWAERSLGLATDLGLPESATALGVLGGARATLGDPQGLDTMRRGIGLALERGDGRRAAMGWNNLGVEQMAATGPREALQAFEEGIELAAQRGMRSSELFCRASALQSRFDLGMWDRIRDEIDQLRGSGSWDDDASIRVQVVVAEIRLANGRGDPERALALAGVAQDVARELQEPPSTIDICSALAETWLSVGDRDRAMEVMRQITSDPQSSSYWNYPLFLPEMARTAARLDPGLARELIERLDPELPTRSRALTPARAVLAEVERSFDGAADQYAAAAEAFAAGGWKYEEAIAYLGRGRCLVALGRPDAAGPLQLARRFFAEVRGVSLLAEADALLADGIALSS
jgi:tetratricopeptide (TPR) repeat protein